MNSKEAKAVFSMTESKGWTIIKGNLENEMEKLKRDWVEKDFDSLEEVKEMQAKIRAKEKILKDVEKYRNKYLKEVNNG